MKHLLYIIGFALFFISIKAQPLVIAHRGASAVAPENTLPAFEAAIKAGADYIETDVHQTRDGAIVIMHDLSVNRTCNIPVEIKKNHSSKKILIKDLSLLEFSGLFIKGWNFSPPTLDSAIKYINGRCKLLIELKKGNRYYTGIEAQILEIIKKNNAEEWVNIIHSFEKDALLALHEKNTGLRLQKLIVFRFPLGSFTFSKHLTKDNFSKWEGVNAYYLFTTKRLIRKLHQQNKTVFAWTVNSRKWAKKLKNRGVDGIISNNPAMIKEIIADK